MSTKIPKLRCELGCLPKRDEIIHVWDGKMNICGVCNKRMTKARENHIKDRIKKGLSVA